MRAREREKVILCLTEMFFVHVSLHVSLQPLDLRTPCCPGVYHLSEHGDKCNRCGKESG